MFDKGLEKSVYVSCLFQDKLAKLDFTPDTRLPDNYQIGLECYYGILYNPFIACKAAEFFFDRGDEKGRGYAMSIMFQASLLHPHLVSPKDSLKEPFDAKYVLADKNPYMYAIGRLLLHGVCGHGPDAPAMAEEIDILISAVRPEDVEVFKALVTRDFDSFIRLKGIIFEEPGLTPYYDAWWERFFRIYFVRKEVLAAG